MAVMDSANDSPQSVSLTGTGIALSQTITFGPLSNELYGTAPFTVSATASSGLAVSFNSQTTSVCTVSGNTVTLLAAGTCTIQATQSGNVDYLAATPVNRSFRVTAPRPGQTVLKSNTLLNISNTTSVWFKGGTEVTISSIGFVQSGTLLNNTLLNITYLPTSSTTIWFMAGTVVSFSGTIIDNVNTVTSGTLLNNTPLNINYTSSTIEFQAGTPILFSGDILDNINLVKTGTLAYNTILYVNYVKTELFSAGTVVTFSEYIVNNINPVVL